MRSALTLLIVVALTPSVALGQRPREEDMHERLTRRLEETIGQQKRVLEDIRTLLQESIRNNRNMEAERVRLELRADMAELKAQIATQGADMKLLKKELTDAKTKVEGLDNRNRTLEAESDTLRSEIAAQALHRQRLQSEVRQLRTMLEEEQKKNKKVETKPDGKKKGS